MISLRKRFFKHTFVVVFTVLALSAFIIDLHYVGKITEQAQQSLRLHTYALLSVAQVEEEELSIPTILSNPDFNTPNSGIWAVVFDKQNQIIWQSLSSPDDLTNLALPQQHGQWVADKKRIEGTDYLTVSYRIVWDENGAHIYQLLVAEDASVIDGDVTTFRQSLAIGFSFILLFLLLFHYLVLRSALRPLAQLENEIYSMEQGELKHLSDNYPRELQGVSTNLNTLIDKENKQRARYRSSMADLAHSLKTPITIIGGELNKYPDNPTLQSALSRMNSSIEYQLQRAVISGHKLLSKGTSVLEIIETILDAMEKIYSDKDVFIERHIMPNVLFYGDENDLLEVLGNLLDNAHKYCYQQITITASESESDMTLIIEDDGPGFKTYDESLVFKRGERLDQLGLGQGIGLAVVYDILKGYNGSVVASSSKLGGAQFTLKFPRQSLQ